MDENELKSLISSLYELYLDNENVVSPLPINSVIFTDDVAKKVLELQPELACHEGFNKNELSNCCGYTCLFADNTATIIISREDIKKNVLWIGTLIHEITHVKDYKEYLHVVGAESFQDMLKIARFWYWTEFHAKYKGCTYMLAYAKKLPPQYFQQYIDEMEKRIREFPSIINKRDNPHFKVYDTMHLMGQMLAFENQSIVLSRDVCNEIYEMYDWFVDTKNFLSKHIDKITNEEMCLLSFNARQIFFDSLWG